MRPRTVLKILAALICIYCCGGCGLGGKNMSAEADLMNLETLGALVERRKADAAEIEVLKTQTLEGSLPELPRNANRKTAVLIYEYWEGAERKVLTTHRWRITQFTDTGAVNIWSRSPPVNGWDADAVVAEMDNGPWRGQVRYKSVFAQE